MTLQPCTWQQVVAALRRCGVEVVKENDDHVFMARMPSIKAISKRGLVPTAIQKDLIVTFGLLAVDYLSYLPEAPTVH
ncbi:MAG TPA: hypothetical protein PLW65_17975 [Pseudomonadota bacterium]|nr:hypothetical protein [Pseudomonadota bacterium]